MMPSPATTPESIPLLPPPAPRALSWAAAVFIHVLVIAAVIWQSAAPQRVQPPALVAELWAPMPSVVTAAPSSAVRPQPQPAPQPTPEPSPPPAPTTPTVTQRDADIALTQHKQQQLEKEQREKAAQLAQAEREKAVREKAAREKAERERAQKLQLAQLEKEKQAKAEREKALQRERQKAQAAAQEQALAAEREATLRRLQGSAGTATAQSSASATRAPTVGAPTAGIAASAGPSAGYAAQVTARVRPNIVYPHSFNRANPRAEVRVRATPDGRITSVQLTRSSGDAAWDEAVVRALHKTATLPRDIHGSVPTDLLFSFQPQD